MTLYPLTRQQQGLWFEYKQDPNDISYNTCVQVEMEGAIDVERFCQSAADAVKHFDMLRAYLVEKDFKPYLAFSEDRYELPFSDFSSGSDETPELRQKAIDLLNQIRLEPIALDKPPLINAHIIKTAANKYYFIGVVPHLISDGVSAVMFLQSLSDRYNLGRETLEQNFSYEGFTWPQYLQYCDEKYPQTTMKEAYDYWQETLAGASHKVDIGNGITQRRSNLGLRYKFEVNSEIFPALKKIARANRTGLFSVISASLAAFIYRYYTVDDLIIGYPVNLRPAGYRNAFGFYVNVLPLKLEFDSKDNFNDLVAKAHQQRKSDKKYQFLPSIDIVRSKRNSDASFDGNMFNISMAETVSRLQNLDLEDVKSNALDNETIEIKDDLSLIYEVSEEGISFWFEYLQELFTEQQIAAMSQHFAQLLDLMCKHPDMAINEFDIVSDTQKEQCIAYQLDSSDEKSDIISEFKKVVAENRKNDALIFNDQKLTYGELDERSDAIATYLAKHVDRTQEYIALALPYGMERIIAMLAVLKAGFAYIPIEEDTPLQRIENIIQDSHVKHIVSLKGFDLGIDNILLSDIAQSSEPFTPIVRDEAYVIYTSGSTGKPKGVLVHQDKVVERINWLKKEFPLQANQRVLQSTSYAFDVSVAEIFWPLFSGASLVVLDDEKRKDFAYQKELIDSYQISAACMVPSAIMALLKAFKDGDRLPFTYLLSAGEAMKPELVDRYYQFGADGSLYNIYGPTEAVIYASCKQIFKKDAINIGQATDGNALYVLNSSLKMQPINSRGQLCIGGDVLAAGYLNNEALTNEKFIDNPYAPGKLYLTGDLVSLDENHNINYHGRIDSQVKIRGYRIEIQEIESVLLQLPDIVEAMVFVNDKTQLVAAIVASSDLTDKAITSHLAQFLPGYMIPQSITRFEALPKLASGKINQKLVKLGAQDKLENVLATQDIIKPQSKSEKVMTKIWSDILRIDRDKIGINSNFFELGGDSLMIIEMECLAEKNNIYLDATFIFKSPTITGLLENASDAPIKKHSQEMFLGEIGLLPRQIKFFDDGFNKPAHWNRISMVQSKRAIDIETFTQSLKEVMNHHDGLRLSFSQENDGWQAYNHGELEPIVNMYDLSDLNKKEAKSKAQDLLNQELGNFDLSKPPLIKVVYLKFKKHYQIALIIHHLLVDMRSCRIILEDLMMSFVAKMQQETMALSRKTSGIHDYLQSLKSYIGNNNFEDEIHYWQQELHYCQEDRDAIEEKDLTIEKLTFDKKKSKELLQYAKAHNSNLHEVLIATFAKNYGEIFNQENLVFNTCLHGRDDFLDDIKITNSVGWFNTVFPVHIATRHDDMLSYVHDKFKHVPQRSLHYLALRYLKKDSGLGALQEPNIFFNYVSKIDRELPKEFSDKLPLQLIEDYDLETISRTEKSCYELYIEAALVDEKIELKIGYLASKYSLEQVRSLF